jgi:hypothetical protein
MTTAEQQAVIAWRKQRTQQCVKNLRDLADCLERDANNETRDEAYSDDEFHGLVKALVIGMASITKDLISPLK